MQETQQMQISLGQEDPLEEEIGNLFQYSCLENPMGRRAWWATICGVSELDMTEHACTLFYSDTFAKLFLQSTFIFKRFTERTLTSTGFW